MKIGILREGKQPPDKRVPFTPEQCAFIQNHFSAEVVVQPSDIRCYRNDEYQSAGIRMQEDVKDCDLLMGIKEVPAADLIPGKKYLFFSHTIKKQPHNIKLMHTLIEKKIQMVDYECLTDTSFNRIIGFGHYAGIVGAYNGIRAYGLRYGLFYIKPAHDCYDKNELRDELNKVRLSNIKIIITGNGRVANGAIELLGLLGIRRITPFEFTQFSYREPTYCQLHSNNYNEPVDGSPWSTERFYKSPEQFRSTFLKYTKYCDLLLHCSFWNPAAPVLFTKKDMQSSEFRISVIADISCDINGAVPATSRASTIEQPFYGYNPLTEKEDEPFSHKTITIMAVDNLPCELPRDASEDFGKELFEKVMPSLLQKDEDGLIERATICKEGELMPRFHYLEDYAFLK
ncbi:MAG: NAD(P)-dependent oxidoreductase [Bacteroidota bacterium]